ncbi:Mg-dependent DNase, partial [Corynespora cassiicola Philippines]
MTASTTLLDGFPTKAPATPAKALKYADVAVTATAKEFAGIYRGKQQHAPDIPAMLDRGLATGVEKVLLTGMYLEDVPLNLAAARERPAQCRITVGVHPYHAVEADEGGDAYYDQLAKAVEDALAQGFVGAFGELGLDYDYLARAGKEVQRRVFVRQLEMLVSRGWKLPLFLHCRAAFEDFVEVMEEYWPRLPLKEGLVHSFVGSKEQMERLVGMGLQVSVNAFAFRDRESLEMVRGVPLDRLQVETDAPWGEIQASSEVAKTYLVNAKKWKWPVKKKDKFEEGAMIKERNECCAVERVVMIVAGIKGVGVEEIAEAAWKNSLEMF